MRWSLKSSMNLWRMMQLVSLGSDMRGLGKGELWVMVEIRKGMNMTLVKRNVMGKVWKRLLGVRCFNISRVKQRDFKCRMTCW